MIEAAARQGLICGQQVYQRHQKSIQLLATLA
jgi:hypothetical protein